MKWIALLLAGVVTRAICADSVDVTFRFNIAGFPGGISVPGEFNGWNNAAWPMSYQGGTLWIRNARLAVGGNPAPGGIAGAWQYKFYYNGASPWPSDPLNHHVNTADNDNSFLYVKDPTIYQLLPNQRLPLVTTSTPTVSAYIFPTVGSVVDTSLLALEIDGISYPGLGQFYNFGTRQFTFIPPPLPNGSHLLILTAGANADTVTFETQGGFVRLLNQSPFSTLKPAWTLNGLVGDVSDTSILIVRNSTDTFAVAAAGGAFTFAAPLAEGTNTFVALADSAGISKASYPVQIQRIVNHSPLAAITFDTSLGQVRLKATSSSDPDSGESGQLSYLWSADPANPSATPGVDGSVSSIIGIPPPALPGEYYFNLIAADPGGNRDTTRNYFTIDPSGAMTVPSLASNPAWVKQGRLYEFFFKSATPQGTINAALPKLDFIASMGYNIIWVMPVMDNAFPINNGPGPGYDIIDFYKVAPEYGTNADFKNFVDHAHQLGLKVILDVTPNHTSTHHPFVSSVRSFRQNSPYWGFYQHQLITNPNYHPYISESLTPDSVFVYYSAFGGEILNYNWTDIDARSYMIGVYRWWVREMGLDGYRLDVYWGPTFRSNNGNGGENEMGHPLRVALKHIKPDILLLGEDNATGVGTETKFGDRGGGLDAAYDWNLFHNGIQFLYTPSPQTGSLNNYLLNFGGSSMGFLPGPNAYFMRFLENHDEERIIWQYQSAPKTMPVSTTVLLSVGLPLVYSGEEVGWGAGIPDYDQRRRGVIDWNSAARTLLLPHYQKLAQIRKQFPPFWSQRQINLPTGDSRLLAYTRPLNDLNGIILANFDSSAHTVSVSLSGSGSPNVDFTGGVQNGLAYHASDLYNDTVYTVVFASGSASLSVALPPFGSSVLVLAESTYSLALPAVLGVKDPLSVLPSKFSLAQNYPNPFNPATTIEYTVARGGPVSLKVYDLLGRNVATLFEGFRQPGRYSATWDASRSGEAGSGIYFYRFSTGWFQDVRKMLLIR
ncbi:MAG TPA: alpha-amylase family glycosyl hydrolase [Bacteroidota bacterium]|jgi:glycosidase